MGLTEAAVAAIELGQPVVIPPDTVYGLVSPPHREEPTLLIQRLKGRATAQPLALLASDLDALLDCVPELHGRSELIARTLLPGPYTLVLANPAGRFPWLNGDSPLAIGVRVPALTGAAQAILAQVGAVVSTSANLHGGPNPLTLADVPEEICAACGAVVDGGLLPGLPSTVIDFGGPEPRVIREGAAPSAEAIARVAAALAD